MLLTAKFNCTIPGTVADFFEECNIIATNAFQPISSTRMVSTVISASANVSLNTDSNNFNVGEPFFNIILIVLGLIFAVLLFITVMLCSIFWYKLAQMKRGLNIVTTDTPRDDLNMDSVVQELEEEQVENNHSM